jgi:hypothetical protein
LRAQLDLLRGRHDYDLERAQQHRGDSGGIAEMRSPAKPQARRHQKPIEMPGYRARRAVGSRGGGAKRRQILRHSSRRLPVL